MSGRRIADAERVYIFRLDPVTGGLRNVPLAAADIVVVWATILWCVVAVWPHHRWVAVAQVLYLVWVSLATAIRLSIVTMNG